MQERLAMLISGGGTTRQEMIKACQSGEVPMDVACVISSTPTAGGIEKARKLGLPEKDILVVNPDDFRGGNGKINQVGFGLAMLKVLHSRGVTVVTQNGCMPLTPEVIIDEYADTMFNQHPGPVPEFGGAGMYGRRVHATRLLFTRMAKRDPWTEAIEQRVLPIEHRVHIDLLKDIAAGKISEVKREPLLIPGEEQTLLLAKRMARLLY